MEDVLIEIIGESNIVKVTIVGMEEVPTVSASDVAATVSSDSFVQAVATELEVGVTLHEQPVVVHRVTSVPSPPPVPPTTPPSPSLPPIQIGSGASVLADKGSGDLTTEMLWVIIIASLLAVVMMGCCVVYWMGKRSAKWRSNASRPSIRRADPTATMNSHPTLGSYPTALPEPPYLMNAPAPGSRAPDVRLEQVAVRLDDVRMLELGMAVGAAMDRARSPRDREAMGAPTTPTFARQSSGAGPSPDDNRDAALTTRLETMQDALGEVIESLSPRSLASRTGFELPREEGSSHRSPNVQRSISFANKRNSVDLQI